MIDFDACGSVVSVLVDVNVWACVWVCHNWRVGVS